MKYRERLRRRLDEERYTISHCPACFEGNAQECVGTRIAEDVETLLALVEKAELAVANYVCSGHWRGECDKYRACAALTELRAVLDREETT